MCLSIARLYIMHLKIHIFSGVPSIHKLLDTIDHYVPTIVRDIESPFLMPIDKAFTVPGRGTVVVGTIKRGVMKKNDEAELMGFGMNVKTSLSDMQIFRNAVLEVRLFFINFFSQ